MLSEMTIQPFHPHPLLRNGHLQTIAGYYLPGVTALRRTTLMEVPVSGGDRIVLCENRASRKAPMKKAILLMHGLGGDANSPYMLRLANLFINRGWHVYRMNHRGCGQGTGLARNTYHSGKSDDISAALACVASTLPGVPIVAAGFSLSGNALLKLLGEQADPAPEELRGALAVTPPIELNRCADALARFRNRLYERRFIKLLSTAVRQRQQQFPDFPKFALSPGMSIRDFDHIWTAPLHCFDSAEHYYKMCSAKQFLPGIEVPTVLLASKDDPFVPRQTFTNLPENSSLHYHITESGGHMGFISAKSTPLNNHRWMDYAIVSYAETLLKQTDSVGRKTKE